MIRLVVNGKTQTVSDLVMATHDVALGTAARAHGFRVLGLT